MKDSPEPREIEKVDLFIAGAGIGGTASAQRKLRTGILMGLHAFLNRFRSPQKLKLPPP